MLSNISEDSIRAPRAEGSQITGFCVSKMSHASERNTDPTWDASHNSNAANASSMAM
jgi:hypothetical protein